MWTTDANQGEGLQYSARCGSAQQIFTPLPPSVYTPPLPSQISQPTFAPSQEWICGSFCGIMPKCCETCQRECVTWLPHPSSEPNRVHKNEQRLLCDAACRVEVAVRWVNTEHDWAAQRESQLHAQCTSCCPSHTFPQLQVLLKLLQRAILLAMPISMKYVIQICYLLSFPPKHTKSILPFLA